jgi:tetratricopeptide (TPR) repeat protein
MAGEMGDYERANELFEESLAMYRELGNRRILTRALTNMGYTAVLRGDHERVTKSCEEAVAILRERGNATPLRASLDTLGWAALLRGDYERSRAIHDENLNMSREVNDKVGVTHALYSLACVEGISGEATRAAHLWAAASALGDTVGYAEYPRERSLREPYRTSIRSRIGETAFEQAWEEGRAMPQDAAIEYALYPERLRIAPLPRLWHTLPRNRPRF